MDKMAEEPLYEFEPKEILKILFEFHGKSYYAATRVPGNPTIDGMLKGFDLAVSILRDKLATEADNDTPLFWKEIKPYEDEKIEGEE